MIGQVLTYFLIFLLAMGGAFIQRVSGFGFGIFVMIFLPYLLSSYGEATALSGLLAGSSALLIAVRMWRRIRWSVVWPLLLVNVVVSVVAIEFMASLSNDSLKSCFGVMFILIALYFYFFDGKARVPDVWWSKGALGALSGVMGGMFAMPGPALVLYCVSHIKNKYEYVATLQAFSVLLNLFYALLRARVGFLTDNTLFLWGLGMFGAVVGTFVGTRLFEHISAPLLKKIVYAMLFISGAVAVL